MIYAIHLNMALQFQSVTEQNDTTIVALTVSNYFVCERIKLIVLYHKVPSCFFSYLFR